MATSKCQLFLIIFRSKCCVVESKKKYKDDDVSSSFEESDEEPDYIPHVETTLDLRGNIRKLFALELALAANGQNMICSPVSALIPLAKLLIGARKKSKSEEELMSATGLKSTKELKGTFKQLIKDLQYLEGVNIYLASRIYVAKKNRLHSKFKHRSQKIFGSPIELVDVKKPAETAKKINNWVYEHTQQKIKDIINKRDITSDVSLILANAIYFQGNWKNPFSKAGMQKFYSPSGVIDAPMMSRTGDYNYIQCDELNAQILEIPYIGEQSAMLVLLPNTKKGLPILLRTLKLSPELLNDALMKMKTAIVEVTIPKFKIETTLDLKHYYKKMGVKRIMHEDQSELDAIVRGETVYLSTAIHKAVIDVDEKGTEAAAATVTEMVTSCFDLHEICFTADRPFLFYITAYHDQLFAGVINSP